MWPGRTLTSKPLSSSSCTSQSPEGAPSPRPPACHGDPCTDPGHRPCQCPVVPGVGCTCLRLVHDQLSCGRRFRVLNIVDDVTKECLGAIADVSLSGRRVIRELDHIIS